MILRRPISINEKMEQNRTVRGRITTFRKKIWFEKKIWIFFFNFLKIFFNLPFHFFIFFKEFCDSQGLPWFSRTSVILKEFCGKKEEKEARLTHRCKKWLNFNRTGYPIFRIRIVSNIPVYLSWSRISLLSNNVGALFPLGLTQRTKWGRHLEKNKMKHRRRWSTVEDDANRISEKKW